MLKKTWQKIVAAALVLLLIAGGIYWYIATDTFSDTSARKAEYSINVADFLQEYKDSSATANQKYTEKIIEITGIVTATEPADSTINIKMADTTGSSYVIFAFQDQHLDEAKSIKVGDKVSIKGSCSGGIYSSILESWAITFKRSAIANH